jgi:predicted nucleic acid-binding protein
MLGLVVVGMLAPPSSSGALHLRSGESLLALALKRGQVMMHPFVLGELACGSLERRDELLRLLGDLPAAPTATDSEVLDLIERRALMGRGIDYIDIHLLASTALAADARIWTQDRRLARAAARLELAFEEEGAKRARGENTQDT